MPKEELFHVIFLGCFDRDVWWFESDFWWFHGRDVWRFWALMTFFL